MGDVDVKRTVLRQEIACHDDLVNLCNDTVDRDHLNVVFTCDVSKWDADELHTIGWLLEQADSVCVHISLSSMCIILYDYDTQELTFRPCGPLTP